MKSGITRLIMLAASAVAIVAGSATASAQCPVSPSYTPDFSSNQSCLTLTGTQNGAPATGYPGLYPAVPPPPPNVSTVLRLTPNQAGWAGSAFYTTQQSVAGSFSTTFTFQISEPSSPPADGFAFVIQSSAQNALGLSGCAVGFADDQLGSCALATGGIPSSLAVEFKTYDDGYPDTYPNGANSVSILSNGTGPNCIDYSCLILNAANNSLPVYMADGSVHTVTISYTLQPTASSAPNCVGEDGTEPCLDVILDGNDLFGGGVPLILPGYDASVDLSTLIGSPTAWVGFTGGTGGAYENQDILSWIYAPQQTQMGMIMTGSQTTFGFDGGLGNNGFDFTGELTMGSPVNAQITTLMLPTQAACNQLVQANPGFGSAECFVYNYTNSDNGAVMNTPLLFELTCPDSPGGTCGTMIDPNFNAFLGTDFNFLLPYNPNLAITPPTGPLTSSTGGPPLVGWLKGAGPNPAHPCQPDPNGTPLFQSNQISSFVFFDDAPGASPIKGGSGGTGSCWVGTYLTPGEAPSVSVTAPADGGFYTLGQVTHANYACSTVNKGNAATGPYLTQSSCTAIDSPGGPVAQGGQFDTSTPGAHTFTATVVDSATNTVSQTVHYTVVGPLSGKICNGVFTGTYKGNLTVSNGQSCTFTNGGVTGNLTQNGGTVVLENGSFVNGNLQVSGGSLSLSNSTVGNDLQINGGGMFSIGAGVNIGGNLQVQNLPASGGTDQVCGATVKNDLQFQNSGTAVLIGGSGCPGNAVGGNLTVQNNTAATSVDSNMVGGNLTDQNNTAATQVFTNAVAKNLQCNGNSSITGGGNTAASKKGQCATF